MRALTIATTLLLLAPACPPAPAPPDAGPAPSPSPAPPPAPGACSSACARLSALDCSEGAAPNCIAACLHVQDAGLTDMHPDCLAAAGSKEAARACGSVRCP